ncbi:MAG TPA: S46 family peptidase, partial [Bacteroidia bacterium]|nr:S46 family peptidase [Bacteroidia bacterium]
MIIKNSFAAACFAVIFFLSSLPARADEGMWLPLLLEQLNQADMQMKGFKLTAADVYSINHTSMKDAVVQFGGGCTAEVISGKGLLLTNHHCGFGQIQAHSTVNNDYLTNGFWAMKESEELPNPGLTATFIVRMEDVTEAVLKNVTPSMNEFSRDSVIRKNGSAIGKEAVKGTHNEAFIRAFYNGNQYFMFITETFRDIRLVGAPPSSIGKFGADADNWVWPRHTGDFSIFRIYANKKNEPADYSTDNIPYIPKYFFPVSLKGEKEGDFSMVMGFPGRTNEYLYSGAIDIIQNVSDPAKVGIRDIRLGIMDHDMKESNLVRIQYASKQSGVSNGWKKWEGEMYGLKRYNAIQKKKEYETEFQRRLEASQGKYHDYISLLPKLQVAYDSMKPIQLNFDYFNEIAGGIEAVKYAVTFENLVKLSSKEKPDDAEIQKEIKMLRAASAGFFKDYNRPTDEKICAALLKLYFEKIPVGEQPDIVKTIGIRQKGDFQKYTEEIYSK